MNRVPTVIYKVGEPHQPQNTDSLLHLYRLAQAEVLSAFIAEAMTISGKDYYLFNVRELLEGRSDFGLYARIRANAIREEAQELNREGGYSNRGRCSVDGEDGIVITFQCLTPYI